jgi:hypothetical protein
MVRVGSATKRCAKSLIGNIKRDTAEATGRINDKIQPFRLG